MLNASERFQKQHSIELAYFIVGCLVFEEVIKVGPDGLNHQIDASKHNDQQGRLECAVRVVARCIEGRLSDELTGLPFNW